MTFDKSTGLSVVRFKVALWLLGDAKESADWSVQGVQKLGLCERSSMGCLIPKPLTSKSMPSADVASMGMEVIQKFHAGFATGLGFAIR